MTGSLKRMRGTLGGLCWTTPYRCDACDCSFLHVELSPAEDEPYGAPPAMLRCADCGGKLRKVGTRHVA